MPGDDITNPVPDLTGYITEGQITLSRDLNRKNIYPEVDVLLSLSRLMNQGIGADHTREDHRGLADQLYASYAKGKDARSLSEIVGEEALSETDKLYLKFGDDFENRYVNQGDANRSIEETLNLGWDLLSVLPVEEMKRLNQLIYQNMANGIVMANNVRLTRIELMNTKKRIKVASRGLDLLKMKRAALVMEFMKINSEIKGLRENVRNDIELGINEIKMSEIIDGTLEIERVSYMSSNPEVLINTKTLWV